MTLETKDYIREIFHANSEVSLLELTEEMKTQGFEAKEIEDAIKYIHKEAVKHGVKVRSIN